MSQMHTKVDKPQNNVKPQKKAVTKRARVVSGDKPKEHTLYKKESTEMCEKFSFIL